MLMMSRGRTLWACASAISDWERLRWSAERNLAAAWEGGAASPRIMGMVEGTEQL